MSEAVVVEPDAVEYPTSDGRPVAETDLHFLRLTDVAYGIRKFMAGREDVYVGSNLLVYDEQGNPRSHLSPDIFVAFGVEAGPRDLFKIWEEKPPAFTLELTSASTRREDERTKRRRYAQWGVAEYFLYDPRAEWLTPSLQGLELNGKRYRAMRESVLANGTRGFHSETLGLDLWLDGRVLRLYDPVVGENLPTPEEEAAARHTAEERASEEAAARHTAEKRAREEAAARRALEADRLAGERSILVRQAESKFDGATAKSVAALLEGLTSTDDLLRVGEWLVVVENSSDLLHRIGNLVDER
ncbi:MAG: Uma2 family endonuclease [Gammaproteobacteria bacterium]|nr:Uma2 family endonuclease [Gammaproteobacteria bacterium]